MARVPVRHQSSTLRSIRAHLCPNILFTSSVSRIAAEMESPSIDWCTKLVTLVVRPRGHRQGIPAEAPPPRFASGVRGKSSERACIGSLAPAHCPCMMKGGADAAPHHRCQTRKPKCAGRCLVPRALTVEHDAGGSHIESPACRWRHAALLLPPIYRFEKSCEDASGFSRVWYQDCS